MRSENVSGLLCLTSPARRPEVEPFWGALCTGNSPLTADTCSSLTAPLWRMRREAADRALPQKTSYDRFFHAILRRFLLRGLKFAQDP